MTGAPRLGVAVAGFELRGPDLVRNVAESQDLELVGLAERHTGRRTRFAARHPDAETYGSLAEALHDPRVEAVVVATPPHTHYELARDALLAGRHVLVDKPLATTVAQAAELIALADRHDRVLMPGHTMLYSPAVAKIRELIASGAVGEVYFVTSSRMNLGLYQPEGVVTDLAPHDVAILLHWLERPVTRVSASGRAVFQPGVPETAFITLSFADGPSANLQISWLAPSKVRQFIVVGSRLMVQFDDTATDESVRIYDRGLDVEQAEPANFGTYRLTSRSGDMVVPHLRAVEPLAEQMRDFAAAVRTGAPPRSDARLGLEVVRVLEAARASLASGGHPTVITPDGSMIAHLPEPGAPDPDAPLTLPGMQPFGLG